jgi:hypothetical protein
MTRLYLLAVLVISASGYRNVVDKSGVAVNGDGKSEHAFKNITPVTPQGQSSSAMELFEDATEDNKKDEASLSEQTDDFTQDSEDNEDSLAEQAGGSTEDSQENEDSLSEQADDATQQGEDTTEDNENDEESQMSLLEQEEDAQGEEEEEEEEESQMSLLEQEEDAQGEEEEEEEEEEETASVPPPDGLHTSLMEEEFQQNASLTGCTRRSLSFACHVNWCELVQNPSASTCAMYWSITSDRRVQWCHLSAGPPPTCQNWQGSGRNAKDTTANTFPTDTNLGKAIKRQCKGLNGQKAGCLVFKPGNNKVTSKERTKKFTGQRCNSCK